MMEPQNESNLIAVYGSLLRSEGMLDPLGAAPFMRFITEARIPGRLFDLGEYPGLCAHDGELSGQTEPTVPGELFAVLDPRALAILDEYEGVQPSRPDLAPFVRQRLRLSAPDVDAWVYLYQGSVSGCPRVVGLGWPEYKAKRQTV
jgi:gamma-glutamylcyclotransferase (GGCT)/AIG2-like uncharacterized protein YtfP